MNDCIYWPCSNITFSHLRNVFVCFYLLYLNDIVAEDAVLNKETIMQVKMPNVNGFINIYEEEKTQK